MRPIRPPPLLPSLQDEPPSCVRAVHDPHPTPTLTELERAAQRLPDSELKTVILATLADRAPTPREALAWVLSLQARRQRV